MIRPTEDFVLIRPGTCGETRPSGVVIPDTVKKSHDEAGIGHVVAVGPGRVLLSGAFVETQIKPGDKVAYKRTIHPGSSEHLDVDGVDHVMLREDYVLAVLEESVS